MGTSIWFLFASLLLASVAGQLYDSESQSYYENLESSSPAPESSPSESQQEEGKEVIFYLTADQAQTLRAAGAVVKPLPELEKELAQQQYQQKNEEEPRSQFQPSPVDDSREDAELDDVSKTSDTQQEEQESEEDVDTANQSAEEATDRPVQNYKYTSKIRQQEYSTQYTQKNLNRGKAEYVRYLPIDEVEKLKIERIRARPGYRFENIKLRNEEEKPAETLEPRQPIEIRNADEFRQVVGDLTRYLSKKPEENESAQTLPNLKDKGPVTFQAKSQEPAKVWESGPARELSKFWRNKEAQEKKLQQKEKSKTPPTIQRQYSSLLAPLAQLEKITKSIDEQKEELIKNEQEIKTKLQQLQESNSHDAETYAAEIDKLNKNLAQQNALAQKLASDAAAKYSRARAEKQEATIKKRRPTQSEKQIEVAKPIPVLVQIPRNSVWKWSETKEESRPIPVPVLQKERAREEKPRAVKIQKPVPIPVARQYYVKADKAYTLQKESEYKPEIPSSLAIIRHIWDH